MITLGPAVMLAEEKKETEAIVRLEGAEMIATPSGEDKRINSAGFDISIADKVSAGALYYSATEYQAGAFGISKKLRVFEGLYVSPGLNLAVVKRNGEEDRPSRQFTAPAWSIRWNGRFGTSNLALVSEGAFLGTMTKVIGRRAQFSDGGHISGQFGRLQAGFTWALASLGEIEERKPGGRVALLITKHFGIAGYGLYLGKPEYRLGLFYQE